MKNIILYLILILLLTSCIIQKGILYNGECRPKNPNFKLSKIALVSTNKIVFQRVYEGTKTSLGLGFYQDGRLICLNSKDGLSLKAEDVIGKDWENAIAIGYWRCKEDKIKVEFFVCQENGFYVLKQGQIKGDTLVFYQNIYYPTRKEVREETFIITNMSFK